MRKKRTIAERNAWRRNRYKETGRMDRRERNLKAHYGISLEQYDAMFATQHGRCAICDQPGREGRNGRLDVDHDHITGKVRALLCHPCNIGIGSLGEDPIRLQQAIQYLIAFGRI